MSDTLALGTLKAGSYEVVCLIAGHEAAGMKATLTVTEGGSSDADMTHGGSGTIDYAKLDKAMTDSILKFPASTKGQGNTPLQPKILADGTKQFDITAEIIDWEIEPGTIVKAWAYNGQVPGPMIRTEVGDRVKLVVTNKLPMGTDVHVHGIEMPFAMDGVAPITQKLIEPGATFTYAFTTPRAAVAMYHAHNHGQMQVTNGLFGVFITGDMPLPAGRTISGLTIPNDIKIAQRIPMVLNDAGVIGLSLNGKSFPATQPYTSKVGDWIMIDYFNEGLQIHPMHQHRFFQLVIAKDGMPLEQPYWVDTLNVAPGERYTVIMQTDTPGTWVWHCHILTHVERDEGAFGMLTAFIVK
jgi:FtsP/CotA-like multicopper oxidase with cupredoxin domain